MSQDDLIIRVKLDPSQFNDEFSRLRRNLESEHRIDPSMSTGEGKLPGEPNEVIVERTIREVIKEQPTILTVSETDPQVAARLGVLEGTINTLVDTVNRRMGLPFMFEQATTEDIRKLFAEATKSPSWQEAITGPYAKEVKRAREMAAFITEQAVARYPGMRVEEFIEDEQMVGALRKVVDWGIFRLLTLTTERGKGIERPILEGFRQVAIRPRITHHAIRDWIAELMRGEHGKDVLTEARRGIRGAGQRIHDVYSAYNLQSMMAEGEKRWGVSGVEVKTSKTGITDVADQLAGQLRTMLIDLGDIQKMSMEQLIDDMLEHPKLQGANKTVAGRIKLILMKLGDRTNLEEVLETTKQMIMKDPFISANLSLTEKVARLFDEGAIEFKQLGFSDRFTRDLAEFLTQNPNAGQSQISKFIDSWWTHPSRAANLADIISLVNPTINRRQRLKIARNIQASIRGSATDIGQLAEEAMESYDKLIAETESGEQSVETLIAGLGDAAENAGLSRRLLTSGLTARMEDPTDPQGRRIPVRAEEKLRRLKEKRNEYILNLIAKRTFDVGAIQSLALDDKRDRIIADILHGRQLSPDDPNYIYDPYAELLNMQTGSRDFERRLLGVLDTISGDNVPPLEELRRQTYAILEQTRAMDRARVEEVLAEIPQATVGLGLDIDWRQIITRTADVAKFYQMRPDEYIAYIKEKAERPDVTQKGLHQQIYEFMVAVGKTKRPDYDLHQLVVSAFGGDPEAGIFGEGQDNPLIRMVKRAIEDEHFGEDTLDLGRGGYKELLLNMRDLLRDDEIKGMIGQANMLGFTQLKRDLALFENASMALSPGTNDMLQRWT